MGQAFGRAAAYQGASKCDRFIIGKTPVSIAMSISLKPEQEQFIQEKLKTGKYQTVDQVIIEAFRLLEERDKDYEQWVQETRAKIDEGMASLERGEVIDGETFVNQLLAKLKLEKESTK